MSRLHPQQELSPSFLDRLVDPEGRIRFDMHNLTEAVRRDLEDLLNTRRTVGNLPQEFAETNTSILTFGLPDLTSLNATTQDERAEIGALIEAIVNRFEPRLQEVHVQLVEEPAALKRRAIAFHIEAKLRADPAPEVAFETILELTTGHYQVKPAAP